MDPITIGLLGAAVVGTGISVYNQVSGAQEREDAERRIRDLKYAQAEELLQREAINEEALREQAQEAEQYATLLAAGGYGGGRGIGDTLRIRRNLAEAISYGRRDANFKAKMLREGADVEMELASDQTRAAWIGAGATVLTSGAQFYSYGKNAFKSGGGSSGFDSYGGSRASGTIGSKISLPKA